MHTSGPQQLLVTHTLVHVIALNCPLVPPALFQRDMESVLYFKTLRMLTNGTQCKIPISSTHLPMAPPLSHSMHKPFPSGLFLVVLSASLSRKHTHMNHTCSITHMIHQQPDQEAQGKLFCRISTNYVKVLLSITASTHTKDALLRVNLPKQMGAL